MSPQRIVFDSSGFDSTINYLKNRTRGNFKSLVASPGNHFAYVHYSWSNMDNRTTPEEFWMAKLEKLTNGEAAIKSASNIRDYLQQQKQSRWLPGILEYLPKGHKFDTIVYLNLGYDNIAYGEDVALNLNHTSFQIEYNEAIYYLMHELAHAGYFGYNETPKLMSKTYRELANNVKFLTHLEGMGVLTPMRLRLKESGLSDPDYITLMNPEERIRRIKTYFEKLHMLEKRPDTIVNEAELTVYDHFSGKPLRLWYIAGYHIAQNIEAELGSDVLRELVKKGSQAFFEKYHELKGSIYD